MENSREVNEQSARHIDGGALIGVKNMLTLTEAARYMGVSKSHLYKLTAHKMIPHYKPTGKMCYFKRADLERWLQGNPVATVGDIEDQANKMLMQKGGEE